MLGISTLLLSACGDRQEADFYVAEEPVIAPESSESAPTADETETPMDRRDALEWEQRLDYTEERQAELADITVELDLDTEAVRTKANSLLDACAAGDAGEAMSDILSEDWYTVMLPNLLIGQRNYTGKAENGEWKLTVIADELGNHYTAAQYPLTDGRNFYVYSSPAQLSYFICAAQDTEGIGVYQGAFRSECLNLTDGSFTAYDGTFAPEGYVEGNFKVELGQADLSEGALPAFIAAEQQTTVYEGEFSEEGKPAIETPKGLNTEGKLAYAQREEGANIYYLTVTEAEAAEGFTAKQLGIRTIWDK